MGASPIYLVTPAPVRTDGGEPVTDAEIIERASQDKYLHGIIQFATEIDDRLSWRWVDELSKERRMALESEHNTDDLAEAIQIEVNDAYDNPDEPLSPLVKLFAADVLKTTVDRFLYERGHGNMSQLAAPSLEGPDVEVYVTGGLSWGDTPTDCYDDLLLLDSSKIFYDPFAPNPSNTTTSTINTDNHDFVVTVSGCTKEQAERVMGERLLHDEDYGFFYTLEYWESR